MTTKQPTFLGWFLRKMAPFLITGAVIAVSVTLIRDSHAGVRRWIEIAVSLGMAGMFVVYLWWALTAKNTGGYAWSIRERLGLLLSGLAALTISLKFAFKSLPGPLWAYLLAAFLMAFVLRPVLENEGDREQEATTGRGRQHPARHPQ